MQFAILGPLKIVVNGHAVSIARPRWRSVVAYLLLNLDRPVSIGQLTSALWGSRPPATASTQLHAAISAIRRALRQAGADDVIETVSGGYSISSTVGFIDFITFNDKVAASRELAGADPRAATVQLQQALALWRGQALDDVNGEFVIAARQRLLEERLAAVERLAELEIGLGNHAQVVPQLMELADAHPLRESLTSLLIQALYRSGRKADALSVYANARQHITSELGLEPGPELRHLHLQILQDEAGGGDGNASVATPFVTARQLPAANGSFTGRAAELAHLRQALTEAAVSNPSRARVVLLHGVGGVGKSTLATQIAQEVADSYPDGQLYIQGPASLGEVLRRCLRGAGQPESALPPTEGEAAACFRSLTARRRLLIVLDNIDDPAVAEPVIPASPRSAVIITSRAPLTQVPAEAVLRVEPMPQAEAVALLTRCARRTFADDDPWLGRIASYCDHLPLALSIAGARLAAEPDLTPQRLALVLSDHRSRLDWLELGGVGVRSSIRIGYELMLSGADRPHRVAAAAFRALGLLPVPSADGGLIAAMTGEDSHTKGSAALDRLARAQLVVPGSDGRCRMHDTVRLVASECAGETMTEQERAATVQRGLAYLTACAMRAEDLLRIRPSGSAHHTDVPADPAVDLSGCGLSSAADVGAWLDRELPNILVAASTAAEGGGEQHALWLSKALSWPLRNRGEFHHEKTLAQCAARAAERLGDEEALGKALLYMGRAELHLGHHDGAAEAGRRSLKIAVKRGDVRAQAQAHNDIGLAVLLKGDPEAARERFRNGVALAERTPEADWINRVMLHNLAHVEMQLGNWEEAALLLAQSMRLRRKIRDEAGTGTTLTVLGTVKTHLGHLPEAVADLTDGIEICRRVGSRLDTARGLAALAIAHLWRGAPEEGAVAAGQSLAEAIAAGDPNAEAVGHRVLAAVLEAADPARAQAHTRRHAAITSLRPMAPEDFAITALLDRLPSAPSARDDDNH